MEIDNPQHQSNAVEAAQWWANTDSDDMKEVAKIFQKIDKVDTVEKTNMLLRLGVMLYKRGLHEYNTWAADKCAESQPFES